MTAAHHHDPTSVHANLRVLQVIARMNVGGPAVIVDDLTRHLGEHGIEVLTACGAVGADEIDHIEAKSPDLPVVRIAGLGRAPKTFDDLRAFAALVRLMRRFRPDVVHTHTAKAGVLGRLAAMVARVPVRVHTFHGHLLHGYFSPRVTKLVVLVERVLAWRTTAIVAVGAQVRDDLLAAQIGRADQYVVIPPAVPAVEGPSRPEARMALGLASDTPVVAFVGRLTAVKRPDRLVNAFAQVLARVPEAVLVIAGDGDLAESVRRDAAPLGDSVRLLGWTAATAGVYAAADVVVLTSDNEGMPVTLIEAAQAGLPAVATRVGSVHEVVADGVTGVLVDTDTAAVAAALTDLLTDADRRAAMGAAARQRAVEVFGVDAEVSAHAQLYRRVARRRAR